MKISKAKFMDEATIILPDRELSCDEIVEIMSLSFNEENDSYLQSLGVIIRRKFTRGGRIKEE